MKKILKIFFVLLFVLLVFLSGYSLYCMTTVADYGCSYFYTINGERKLDGAIIDLALSEKQQTLIYVRIKFRDTNKIHWALLKDAHGFREFDSFFSIFGYYNNRFDVVVPPYNTASIMITPYVRIFDRKEKKIIYQYKNQEFSITKDGKILECNNVKIFLRHDKLTTIIVKNGEPLSIIVQERNKVDNVFLPWGGEF
jgi:hypothetical protein